MDHCHGQMRQLNQVLFVKKEEVLKYQDQIANMKAELAELRDARMEGVRSEGGGQGGRQGERGREGEGVNLLTESCRVMGEREGWRKEREGEGEEEVVGGRGWGGREGGIKERREREEQEVAGGRGEGGRNRREREKEEVVGGRGRGGREGGKRGIRREGARLES